MLRQAVVLAVAFAVAGPAAAMAASSLQASGQVSTDGILALLLREGAAPDASDFFLEAQNLRVEVDNGSTVALGATYHSVNPTTDVDSYGASTVASIGVRDRQEWLLVPTEGHSAPRIVVSGDCQEVSATDEDVERTPWVKGTRGALTFDADRVVEAGACGAAFAAEVSGDFTLVLWEWDVRLESNGTVREIHTGRSTAGPAGVQENGVQERRQVFLYAEDAILRASLDAQAVLYLREVTVETHGSLLVRDVHGVLAAGADAITMDGGSVLATGDLLSTTTRSGDSLQVEVGGDIRELHVNGRMIQAQVEPPVPSWPWVVLVVGAATVLLVALAWQVYPARAYRTPGRVASLAVPRSRRERMAMGWNVLAKRALRRDRRLLGLFCAHQACRKANWIAEHALARLEANHALGRRKAALEDHCALAQLLSDRKARGENAMRAARLCLRLGRDDEATEWIKVARREDIHCIEEALGDARLRPLVARAFGLAGLQRDSSFV